MILTFRELCNLFFFSFIVISLSAFIAFLFFTDFSTAVWAALAISLWQTTICAFAFWELKKMDDSGYSIRNIWWLLAAKRIEISPKDGMDYVKIDKWCEENLRGKWEREQGYTYVFLFPSSAIAFKLRWYE